MLIVTVRVVAPAMRAATAVAETDEHERVSSVWPALKICLQHSLCSNCRCNCRNAP